MTRKQISLRQGTYQDLKQLAAKGQTFDGIVTELIEKRKQEVEA